MQSYAIRVRGQVQGVGFRPYVWQLANALNLKGDVRNDGHGVQILLQGGPPGTFVAQLRANAPPLARIDAIDIEPCDASPRADFAIADSRGGKRQTGVTPDARMCPSCLDEIRDPSERRFGYAFANCTHCGPRFTILERIPYDRASTTMARFKLCTACNLEYRDPDDRRFHAQPIACPACGPHLWFEKDGRSNAIDPIAEAVSCLRDGEILALKGLGGFHLACDALNEKAIVKLRQRKRRPSKPFALMAVDLAMIRRFAEVHDTEAALLQSPAAPAVLLGSTSPLAGSVAPGQWATAWMVPTTPLHQLLLDAFAGPLVMTSGNLSNEPQVIDNQEAREKLTGFVDGFLMHDRDIARRVDDSVARVARGEVCLQRRARGYAPATIPFMDGPPVLATGGLLKSTICLTRDSQALLSHHLGDLQDALTAQEFDKALIDYAALFDHTPELLACDLHPDYRSTAAAEAMADGRPVYRVQHHHAHIAAVMAERGWHAGPVVGLALDGLGLGSDGTVWGGEILFADYCGYERLDWLRPVPLPGGQAAQREPWRNLMAQLDAADLPVERFLSSKPVAALRAAIAKGVNCPLSSSCGRLFDAVAAAIGIAPERQSFEGEAAMALETLARRAPDVGAYRFDGLDPTPMWHALLTDIDRGEAAEAMAARFHAGLADAFAERARHLAKRHGTVAVALSGGCLQNATLLEALLERLDGLTVLTHSTTPPNDGSLALGQAAVAVSRAVSSLPPLD